VSPAFRSRRSSLVYSEVLEPAGIKVYCLPVFGVHNVKNWTDTWHGRQDVALQFIKLQYYRFDIFGLRRFLPYAGRWDRQKNPSVRLPTTEAVFLSRETW